MSLREAGSGLNEIGGVLKIGHVDDWETDVGVVDVLCGVRTGLARVASGVPSRFVT